MIQSILSNLAIILLLHLLMVTINNSKNRLIQKFFPIVVILIFSAATIAMFYLPIKFENYYVDLRAIPLIALAYIRGWKPVIPVLIIVSMWRLLMGGDGAIPGIIFGMVGPTLFTLIFHNKDEFQSNYLKKIIIVTICWFISDFPIVIVVPNGLDIFQNIFLIRYGSFLGAALILFSFITMERKRQILSEQLQFFATHDSLTGLMNKKTFIEMINNNISMKNDQKQYIAMIDVDHFKTINDKYGHLFGDEVLVKLASIFLQYESEQIQFARFGGEEFIVYINKDSISDVEDILEDLKNKISSISFHTASQTIHVTVSIGVSQLDGENSLFNVIRQADTRLYRAKEKGRNKLVLC